MSSALRQRLAAIPFVTLALFLVCVVIFLLAERDGSTTDTATLMAWGAVKRSAVLSGDWWRLVTAMFLHIGWLHLGVNLYFGYSWAVPMERLLGHSRFLIVYVVSGLCGTVASVIGQDVVSAGASGALFGLMGGTMAALRLRAGSWGALWAHEPLRQTMILGVLWLLIGPWVGFDSFAHAGGLVAGGAMTWVMLKSRRSAQQ